MNPSFMLKAFMSLSTKAQALPGREIGRQGLGRALYEQIRVHGRLLRRDGAQDADAASQFSKEKSRAFPASSNTPSPRFVRRTTGDAFPGIELLQRRNLRRALIVSKYPLAGQPFNLRGLPRGLIALCKTYSARADGVQLFRQRGQIHVPCPAEIHELAGALHAYGEGHAYGNKRVRVEALGILERRARAQENALYDMEQVQVAYVGGLSGLFKCALEVYPSHFTPLRKQGGGPAGRALHAAVRAKTGLIGPVPLRSRSSRLNAHVHQDQGRNSSSPLSREA